MGQELDIPTDPVSDLGESSIEKRPTETPASVRPPGDSVVSQFMARFGAMSSPSLIDKANTEQLDKLIDQADDAAKREDAYRGRVLSLVFWLGLSVIILVGALCWMFLHYQKAEALQQIVTLLVGLGGGSVGGFGVGRASVSKSSD